MPFCGKDELVVESNGPFGQPVIRCKTCNAQGPPSMNEKGAIDWWNTREDK